MTPNQTKSLHALKLALEGVVTATLVRDNGLVELGVSDGRRFVVKPDGSVRQER